MTKLNKIAQVMVIAGVAQFSVGAFAANIGLSQTVTVSNETNVSQSSNTKEGRVSAQMSSNTSAESSTQADAETQSTSMSDMSDPSATDNDDASTDGQIEDEPANEEESASATEAEQSSMSNMDVNNVVQIGPVQTATSETLARLSSSGNQLVADVSESFEGQLTSATNLASNTALDTVTILSANTNAASESGNATESELQGSEADLVSTLDNSILADTTANLSSNVADTLGQDTALSAATDASAIINQTVQATVLDSISSNTQSSISESVNGQITTLVSEQINNEIAVATATEVVNTISNDLDLGL